MMTSLKFAKALPPRAPVGEYKQEAGHLLELIPQADPLTLAAGAKLPVLVKLAGKPMTDAALEVSDLVTALPEDKIPRYATNAQGIAMVPIRAKGMTVLVVDVARPNDGTVSAEAKQLPVDKLMMVATYAFIR